MARMRATATIPEDIIVDIVTTLPIKSVGRCRCVCKRWCYLFSGPKFAKSRKQSAFERQTLSRRLVVNTHECELLDLDLREEKQKSSFRKGLNVPFKKPEHSLGIIGSCNGLVACLRGDFVERPRFYTKGTLFIWNPSTGFYKEIAGQDFYFRPGKGVRGFGHVSGTDDYKVVLGRGGRLNREFDIFSLRTRTWNTIKSPEMGNPISPMQNRGLFLRDALHWLASSNYEQDNTAHFLYFKPPLYVFALDLEKEELRKMQVPIDSIPNCTDDKIRIRSRLRLGVSCEGCLYIMQYPGGIGMLGPGRIDNNVDIVFWVMREYGNSESWTRSLTLRLSDEPDNPINLLEPILLMETCAFVMNRPLYMSVQDKNKAPAATDMYMVHDHNNKEKGSLNVFHSSPLEMIVYGESLTEEKGSLYVFHSSPLEMIVYEESLCEYEEGQKALIIYVPQGLITLR